MDNKKLRQPFKQPNPSFPDIDDADLTAIVHQTTDASEARLLVVQLESRNIPAVKTAGDLPGQPFLVLFSVQVAQESRDAAEAVIASFEPDEIKGT